MTVVVDTSVFVAAFRGTEPHSEPAIRLAELIEAGAIHAVIPDTVLVETVASIRRRTGEPKLAQRVLGYMKAWSSLRTVRLTPRLLDLSLELAAQAGLRGMDTVVLATALRKKLPLVTFDYQMAQLAAQYVEVLPLKDLVHDEQ